MDYKIFAIFIFFLSSIAAQTDINNPRSCPPEIQNPDKTTCCENLNKVRDDFVSCCNYPIMVIYRDFYDECSNNCASDGQEGSRCCILSCCFKGLGIITGNSSGIIDTDGLIKSFTMSVDNAELWQDKISCVVNNCSLTLTKEPPSSNSENYKDFWDCYEQIPMYFYDIVDCAYDYNYMYCPNYPFQQGKCYETFYYVNDCFVNGARICGNPDVDPRSNTTNNNNNGNGNNETNGEQPQQGDNGQNQTQPEAETTTTTTTIQPEEGGNVDQPNQQPQTENVSQQPTESSTQQPQGDNNGGQQQTENQQNGETTATDSPPVNDAGSQPTSDQNQQAEGTN